jgi:hypothetical protein
MSSLQEEYKTSAWYWAYTCLILCFILEITERFSMKFGNSIVHSVLIYPQKSLICTTHVFRLEKSNWLLK